MEKIKIITDSASDISFEAEKQYGIDIIPYTVVIGDKEYTSRVDFDNNGFYQLMDQYDEIPKTSQITSFRFQEKYLKAYQEGYTDIIVVLINAGGSATFNNSRIAVETFFEEHPECRGKLRISCHDSKSYTGAYGYPVIEAAKMIKEGKAAEEINRYLTGTIPKRRIYFGMTSLKYAGKSGRIPGAAAFVGDKLGIKPVMKIWDHEITTAAKCRGDKKMLAKVISLAVADMEPGSDYQVVYGSNTDAREQLISRMTAQVGYEPTDAFQIGSEIASNAGPKVMGVIFNVKQELQTHNTDT